MNSSLSTVSLSRINCDTDSSVARLLIAALAVVLTTGLTNKHNYNTTFNTNTLLYSNSSYTNNANDHQVAQEGGDAPVPMNRNHVNEVWRAHMYLFVLRTRQPLSTLMCIKSRSVMCNVTAKKG